MPHVADVTDPAQVEGYAAAAREQWGTVDRFFDKAGVEGLAAPITLRGSFLGLKYVLPLVADNGAVINTAKGAVVNLTRELGLEYATAGIQVNALCPGFSRTRLPGGAYDDADFVAAVTAFTPMGRVAEAEEIRGPALFLASPASDYMTGQTLVVDGGCMAK